MPLWDIKLFKEIASNGSVSKAAARCGISQSAASQHLHEVEHRLGLDLLDRSKRPLELTEAGKLYFEFCRDVLRREDQLGTELDRLKGEAAGDVRVASIYSVGLSEMSRLQHEFEQRYPAAHLHVEYMRPDRIYEAVRAGTADLGIVSYPFAARDIAVIRWRDEEMQLAVTPGHRLARVGRVVPHDVAGENFIGFDEDLPIRRELDRYLRGNGVEVNLAMHFDNIQMVKEAVALGSGVSILPARTMQTEIAQGRLVAVPLDAPELVRPVGVIHLKRKKLTRAAQAFVGLLGEG